jgi:hypothetical protein
MEPPKTPEEQAELERAIADMLQGREPTPSALAFSQFMVRVLDRVIAPSQDDDIGER